jgi:hypothetical protein
MTATQVTRLHYVAGPAGRLYLSRLAKLHDAADQQSRSLLIANLADVWATLAVPARDAVSAVVAHETGVAGRQMLRAVTHEVSQ